MQMLVSREIQAQVSALSISLSLLETQKAIQESWC